jgi:hypothetical protein
MLYLGYSICGTGAYGDLMPYTPSEKICIFTIMIIAKFFVAFIYAEASHVVSNVNAAYTRHISQLNTINE